MQERAVSQAHQSIQEMVNAQVRVETFCGVLMVPVESLDWFCVRRLAIATHSARASAGNGRICWRRTLRWCEPDGKAAQMGEQFGTVLRACRRLPERKQCAFREAAPVDGGE